MIAVSITNYEKDERPWPRFLINGIAGAVLLLMVGATSTFATGKRVDLELVLAIDVSRSIDKHEAELQRMIKNLNAHIPTHRGGQQHTARSLRHLASTRLVRN